MEFYDALNQYCPKDEQEQTDKAVMLDCLKRYADVYERSNLLFHVTASAWITNEKRDRVLLIYHNIYDSWAWTGGHAEGGAQGGGGGDWACFRTPGVGSAAFDRNADRESSYEARQIRSGASAFERNLFADCGRPGVFAHQRGREQRGQMVPPGRGDPGVLGTVDAPGLSAVKRPDEILLACKTIRRREAIQRLFVKGNFQKHSRFCPTVLFRCAKLKSVIESMRQIDIYGGENEIQRNSDCC